MTGQKGQNKPVPCMKNKLMCEYAHFDTGETSTKTYRHKSLGDRILT